MVTLASIVIAVPLGALGGLLLGLAGYRWQRFEKALTPVLDLMQTVPVFAYLVPILFLFGFGPTAAVVATIIYALPPMTRVTIVALKGVSEEIRDLGAHGRLLAPTDELAGHGAIGHARVDGRGQSGDHAVTQHGDHRLDDRGRWSRLRGAGRPSPARYRHGHRGRPCDRRFGDRARSSLPGVCRQTENSYRGDGCRAHRAPPLSSVCARSDWRDGAPRHQTRGVPGLPRELAALHRQLLVGPGALDQRQLLRSARGVQGSPAAQSADSDKAPAAWPSLGRRGRPHRPWWLVAGRVAPGAYGRRSRLADRPCRPVGEGDGYGLSLRDFRVHRLPDRYSHRHHRRRV